MKRLFTILLVAAAVALAVAYPLPPKVASLIWAVLLTGAAVWVFQQRDRKANLRWPCVMCSSFLAVSGCILISGHLLTWFVFLFYGFLTLVTLRKLRSHFQWENLVGTIGSAGFALLALIELLR